MSKTCLAAFSAAIWSSSSPVASASGFCSSRVERPRSSRGSCISSTSFCSDKDGGEDMMPNAGNDRSNDTEGCKILFRRPRSEGLFVRDWQQPHQSYHIRTSFIPNRQSFTVSNFHKVCCQGRTSCSHERCLRCIFHYINVCEDERRES